MSPESNVPNPANNPGNPAPSNLGPRAPFTPSGPPRRPDRGATPFFGCLFAVSVILNVGAAAVIIVLCCAGVWKYSAGGTEDMPLSEHLVSGNASAKDKVAVIQLDGAIMEGTLGFVHKQIEQAGKDKQVKAVVLRVNSPGGSITASEDLYRRLTDIANGNDKKKYGKKPLVVSMASMAASGGYYVSMAGQVLYAERTTMTGSIGVYGAFLDVHKFTDEHGIGMNVIKQGDIKDSGSPFKEMKPHEKEVWQDMIDDAYNQFLDVVVEGRKDHFTKEDLLKKFEVKPVKVGDQAKEPYKRNIADGGVWTATKAKELKLIDKIGTLDDAIEEAHDLAKMGGDYKAVQYEKPRSPVEMLLGIQSAKPAVSSPLLDPARLRNGLTPRLWYLAPGCELAGFLSAVEAER